MRLSAKYSTMMSSTINGDVIFAVVSEGRCASRPRCDKGSAAMKITSRTSSTSIIGVMFISEVGRGIDGLITALTAKA